MRLAAVAVFPVLLGASSPASACSSEPFLGELCAVALKYCPLGYMEAAGQELQTAEFRTLAYLLGTAYGGDGVRTFKLPDLRGRELVGENPTGANGLPAVLLGAVVPAKSGLNSANLRGQTIAMKYCIAVSGRFPSKD